MSIFHEGHLYGTKTTPTGQRQHSHTTHKKHRVTEIYLELAAEAEFMLGNQPEEDL